MPIYQYKAFKEDGKIEAGVMDADTPRDARSKLKARRLHVTDITEVQPARAVSRGFKLPPLFRRRKIQELSIITRQLATLLNSGIPLMGSLTALIEQVEDARLKAVLMDVREKVAQGGTFANALEANPVYFNDLYVNMVRSGEASGKLDTVLDRLADYLQTQARIQGKVAAAMTYPIVLLLIGTTVVVFLLTFVVPKIVDTLQQHHKAALPLPTEILLGISAFVKGYWWLLAGIVIFLVICYRTVRSTSQGRLAIDKFWLDVPVLGQLIKKQAISRFSSTLATLLESGLPVLESLTVVKRVVDNRVLADAIEVVRQKITEGSDIASSMKQIKVFPPVVGYMIAVGEESGRLEDLLRKISNAYDEDIEITTQKLTSLIEPVMIVFMAIVVGFIVLSILLPILQMSSIK